MKITDFNLLKKLLNMTLSGADQERLTAIDKANEIVRKSNTTWDRILDRVIKVEVEIESVAEAKGRPMDGASIAARKAAFNKKVEDAFETIEASDPRADAADFIASLKSQWDRNGLLSEEQLKALWKFEERASDRTARFR